MGKILNALTDELLSKLEGLPESSGTEERLTTVRSLDLVLDGTEQVIEFDQALTSRANGLSVTEDGTVLAGVDGYFNGSLSIFVDKSGGAGASLALWMEKKPLSTGTWELASPSMSNPVVFDDGGLGVAISGTVDCLAGDEVRIMIKKISGSAKLTTKEEVVSLGTISHFAAALSVFKIGPVTP